MRAAAGGAKIPLMKPLQILAVLALATAAALLVIPAKPARG
ncbi:MAG: hypothetical protein R3B82_24580 [Sandaracinaceae bacterium]